MFGSVAGRLAAAMAAAEMGLPPDSADAMFATAQRMGVDFDRFGASRSNEEVISTHNRTLRSTLADFSSSSSSGKSYVSLSTARGNTKPPSEFPRPPPYASLMPISCADLQPNTTHRRRVLKGRLVVDALLMTGVHSVLQDEAGDVVKVTIYNSPEVHRLMQDRSSSYQQCFKAAQQLFPKGKAVAIIEPFYKLNADGGYGVRVDNPAEVLFLDSLTISPEALQQQGHKHLAAHQYKEAAASYTQLLDSMLQSPPAAAAAAGASQPPQAHLLLPVLLNLSATHLQLQQPLHALLYASAAASLSSHSSSKAFYRAAVALDQMLGASGDGSCSSSSDDSKCIARAANELMETSAKLAGATTAAARAQLMAALTNVSAAASGSSSGGGGRGKPGRSSSSQQPSEEWQVVCKLLAEGASKLSSCFSASSSSPNSSDSTDALAAAEAAKEAGNAAFKNGSFSAALRHYSAALNSLQSATGAKLAELLQSRSAAWLAQPSEHSQQQACLDALSAALMHPQQAAAPGFATAATALLELNEVTGATAVCEQGLQLSPRSAELLELQQRIQTASTAAAAAAAAAADAAQQQASSSTSSSSGGGGAGSSRAAGQRRGKKGRKAAQGSAGSGGRAAGGMMTEREMKEFAAQGTSSVEQVAMVNQLASMAARMSASGGGRGRGGQLAEFMMPDERVPKLHDEFSKGGRWPPQVDIHWAQRQLWEAYELGRALPMHMRGLLKPEAVTPQLLLPRLGMLSKERVTWLLEAEMGSVSFPTFYPPYGGGWQSFVNAPARTEVLTPGTTHVAIGFVDVGGLAAACEMMAAQDPRMASAAAAALPADAGSGSSSSVAASGSSSSSSSSSSSGPGGLKPLSWVGFEMSAPCVAKTLVLLQMVEQGAAEDEILQVWYSACWSNSTLTAFRRAVTELLTTAAAVSAAPADRRRALHASADALATPEVLELLSAWQTKNVTLAAARRGWQANTERSAVFIGNFKRKADRLALCELVLTGELRALGRGDVGSLCMFAVPDKFGERAFSECFLQCLPFHTLVEAWLAQPSSDIVAVGVQLLRRRARLFVGMLRARLVLPEVHLAAVHLKAPRTIAAIAALQPYTISWSNVPDYIAPRDFHKLARAVSAPADTVHFMHSMNWIKAVKGACHLDFILCMREDGLKQFMPELKQAGGQAAGLLYAVPGVSDLLLSPPIDNVRNLVDFGLFTVHHKAYVKAFFAPALSGMRVPQRQVQIVEPPLYSIISRTNSTMHLTFSYDDAIVFHGVHR